ncbi:hypothetical protein EYF80_065021 [Liparis tanakae]|uniref:Uncharacterized protein n=1 Tax=Liparis tanakae TaxID=230148 RepID=A0A4Z2E860_9TELE|nr:hypothetical protein EYF80_065021 [Liparis tanakae]
MLDGSALSSEEENKMTKLQFLNVFLTERLMLAAQEIYKSVEDTILEYQEEIAVRERENDHLRRRLRDAGMETWPGAAGGSGSSAGSHAEPRPNARCGGDLTSRPGESGPPASPRTGAAAAEARLGATFVR